VAAVQAARGGAGIVPDYGLDPQARALLEGMARPGSPSPMAVPVAEARRLYRESRLRLSPAPPLPMEETRDFPIPGPAGAIGARYYRPQGAKPGEPLCGVVYFHGGGWVCGDLDTHDGVCRGIAASGPCAVVAVDYRMGPEHRFPAAVDDAVAAAKWVCANAGALGMDPGRIVVAGESAGGNLAAVIALALRDAGPRIAMQVLVYPVTDQGAEGGSMQRYARGYSLTLELMRWYQDQYFGEGGDRSGWRASPLLAEDHSRLPPAYVVTAGFDPLLDQGRAYADCLLRAGVAVTYECFEGQIHGFLPMGGAMAASNHALYRIGQAMRSLLPRRSM
jgi:acetyl esterase